MKALTFYIFFGEQIIDSVHSVHFDDSTNQQKDHPFVIEVRHIVDVVVKQGAEKAIGGISHEHAANDKAKTGHALNALQASM